MSDIVQEAIRRRDHLVAELARLNHFLETARMLKTGEIGTPNASFEEVDGVAVTRAELTSAGIVGVVSDVLRNTGRPLARGELYRRLKDAGVRVAGTDPVKNLGTILWRSGRFDNTGRTYWFKGEPRPDHG